MNDEPLASGAVVHACYTDASSFVNLFAKLLCDVVCHSKAEAAMPGPMQTMERFYRDWSVEDAMNQIFVESATDFSARHRLAIFSEMIHWLSRDVDIARGNFDYTETPEEFGAVVAGDLLHAQTERSPHLTDSIL
jgi:hypothetical protein